MNKLSYIVLGLSFLTLFSCQKEVIAPSVTSNNDNDTDPKWKPIIIVEKSNSSSNSDNTSNTGQFTILDSEIGGGITDPNNDPDITKKKKSKR